MNNKEIKAKLKEYMAIPRVSGYESIMTETFMKDMSNYTDNVVKDKFGNVIATFKGCDENVPSLMIFTHLDTIGFFITYISDDGFIKFDRIGGVPERVLPGLHVRVGSESGKYYSGVIGNKSYNMMPSGNTVDPISSLYIDIGAKSREEVESLDIHVGSPIVYDAFYKELLNDRICGSYLDAASGLTTLIQLAEDLKDRKHKATVYLVGTVMEEYNARGAMMAHRVCDADLAICLLGAGAGDTPELKGSNNVKLGEGTSVNLFNFHGKGTLNGLIVAKPMLEHLKKASETIGVTIQRQAARGALSDSAYLQLEDDGVMCLDMGTPDRYSHSPVEMIDLKDFNDTFKIVKEFIDSLDENFKVERF